jgi:GWxTD domain-containing protein
MLNILGVLGESSVRAVVIAVAVAGVLRGMHVKSPVVCHRTWTGVLLAMLFLPIISLWAPRIAIPLLPPVPSLQTQGFQAVGQNTSPEGKVSTAEVVKPKRSGPIKSSWPVGVEKQPGFRWSVYQTVVIFYLIGFLILVVRLLAGTLLSYRLAHNARRDDKGFYISQLSAPLTIGLFRTRIFLPLESRHWDSGKLSAVLIHEREHMRRRDPLVEWLGLLNRCIYWFHPLAWWLCGKLSALAEQSCDEAVISRGHDCFEYAGHLLDFARSVKQRGAMVTAWGSSLHGSTLALRIRRIVSAGPSPAISRPRLVLVIALCVGASLVPAICELTHARAAAPPVSKISIRAPGITLPEKTVAQNQHSRTLAREIPYSPALPSPPPRTAPPDMTVTQHQHSQTNSPNPPDKILHDAGLELLEKHKYEEARRAFQTLINTYPDSGFIASSYLAIGDSFFEEGGEENLLRAEDQYKNFVIFFPTHPKAADAQMKAISIYIKIMNSPGREQQYQFNVQRAIMRFIEQYPESDFVPSLRKYLNRIQQSGAKGNSVDHLLQSRENDRSEDYTRQLNDDDVAYLTLDEYYRRWLDDVVYIISKEEVKAFLDLKSDEERRHFIEQFWARRNPDPLSKNNVFKEEHYRRVAYANERFAAGGPGWKTDRGRIYIMYGPPSEIESHPSGGTLNTEGGQISVNFPFEIWRYRHIDGIGDDVWVEFADQTGAGDYRFFIPRSIQR